MTARETDTSPIDDIVSRQAIEDLWCAYCRGVDRGDADLLSSIFHDDSTVVSGVFNGPGQEFARQIVREVDETSVRVFHSIHNVWVAVDGDQAKGECYVFAVQTVDTPDGRKDILVGGRYLTRFERRDAVWKILEHTFVLDWNMIQPCTAVMDEGAFGAMVQGCRGRADPVYSLWGVR